MTSGPASSPMRPRVCPKAARGAAGSLKLPSSWRACTGSGVRDITQKSATEAAPTAVVHAACADSGNRAATSENSELTSTEAMSVVRQRRAPSSVKGMSQAAFATIDAMPHTPASSASTASLGNPASKPSCEQRFTHVRTAAARRPDATRRRLGRRQPIATRAMQVVMMVADEARENSRFAALMGDRLPTVLIALE